jgi:hypothetical protein
MTVSFILTLISNYRLQEIFSKQREQCLVLSPSLDNFGQPLCLTPLPKVRRRRRRVLRKARSDKTHYIFLPK